MIEPHVDLLNDTDDRWPAALKRLRHDVYHRPEYGRVSARSESGTAQAALVSFGERELLIPFVRRPLPSGHWDAVSPYGYSGPIASASASQSEITLCVASALQFMASAGCVSFFVRSHPFMAEVDWPAVGFRIARDQTSPTTAIDLARRTDDVVGSFSSTHRYEIRRATRAGYHASESTLSEDIIAFASLYRDNMERLQASDSYLFPDTYFTSLANDLGEDFHLITVRMGQDLAGGTVFLTSQECAQYHLSAASLAHRRFSPARLAIAHATESDWGRKRHWLHLGGGRGGTADSLLAFKQGFGGVDLKFRSLGLILDESAYGMLEASATTNSGDKSSRFPAYR